MSNGNHHSEEAQTTKTEDKYKYYARLDEYEELRMTPFGKMKLSVVPEGLIYSTYNYFKTQGRIPSYDKFLDACLKNAELADIELKPRWRKFFEACTVKAIDTKGRTHFPPKPQGLPDKKPDRTPQEIEDDFWRIERYKINAGKEPMRILGDPQNPYRLSMKELPERKHEELFILYMNAYPKDADKENPLEPSYKDLEAYITYVEALLKD